MKKIKVAIIGSGPAGYTAAVYTSRANLETVMFSGLKAGGQLMYTSDVENFPGFPEGKNGPQLMMAMQEQVKRFGTEIVYEYVTAVDFSQRPFKLWTKVPATVNSEFIEKAKADESLVIQQQIREMEADYEAEAVIITTGAASIMLGVPGEEKLFGRGVSTCAVCDAAFYKDKDTFVIGGGDSAMEDTMALTKFAKSVTVIHRRDQFKASKIMQDRVLNNEKVKIIWNSELVEVIGDEQVKKIKVKNTKTNEETEFAADGVFVAIGHRPATTLFKDQIATDDHGYILTRLSLSKSGIDLAVRNLDDKNLIEYPSMTTVEGVFAAGDVVDVRYKQAITAAGQGCAAALDAERWLEAGEGQV